MNILVKKLFSNQPKKVSYKSLNTYWAAVQPLLPTLTFEDGVLSKAKTFKGAASLVLKLLKDYGYSDGNLIHQIYSLDTQPNTRYLAVYEHKPATSFGKYSYPEINEMHLYKLEEASEAYMQEKIQKESLDIPAIKFHTRLVIHRFDRTQKDVYPPEQELCNQEFDTLEEAKKTLELHIDAFKLDMTLAGLLDKLVADPPKRSGMDTFCDRMRIHVGTGNSKDQHYLEYTITSWITYKG